MAERPDSGPCVAAPRCLPQDLLASTSGIIDDNAKRSVSVRINTSDYGRIKIAARRLRTREADVFRYLLQVGLSRITPLLNENLDAATFLDILAELGPDLASNLGLAARDFAQLLLAMKHQALPDLSDEDYELIDLAATHPRLALQRLAAPMEADVRAVLVAYLRGKYLVAISVR